MEETFSTKAIILNHQPFREHDSKTVVYGRERGKLELVARGTQKIGSKLSGHLQPISLTRIMVVRGKHFDYIGGADCDHSFRQIKNDWHKIIWASRAMSVCNKMLGIGEPDDALFDLVCGYLGLLENAPEPHHGFYYHGFILKLLVGLGYQPELYACVICRHKVTPHGNYFNPDKGGVVCTRCREKLAATTGEQPASATAIKTLRLLAGLAVSDFPRLKIQDGLNRELANIITSFHAYHCC